MAGSLEERYETPAAYRAGRVPTYWNQHPGVLRLADGRLSFVETDGKVRFDVPVAECHSLAEAELGTALAVWHGATRHRVVVTGSSQPASLPSMVVGEGALGTALGAGAVAQNLDLHHQMTGGVDAWMALLGPLVAPAPPPGVRAASRRAGCATC